MSRIAYVSGRYVAHREAAVSIDDRGYQFADGVYEVIAVEGGVLLDEALHLARLDRSLAALAIARPVAERALRHILRRVVRLNRVVEGIVYLQVTRGVARRDHAFPPGLVPQLVVTARNRRPPDPALAAAGVRVITIPDQRWARRDIKSISLLPNVLGKEQARQAGAYEAWQVDPDGTVTEGTSSNAWIVTAAGEIVTRAAAPAILNGVTRLAVLALAEAAGLRLSLRPFTVAEAKAAREAFLTSASSFLLPVVRIDEAVVGHGVPGSFTLGLRERLTEHYARQAQAAG